MREQERNHNKKPDQARDEDFRQFIYKQIDKSIRIRQHAQPAFTFPERYSRIIADIAIDLRKVKTPEELFDKAKQIDAFGDPFIRFPQGASAAFRERYLTDMHYRSRNNQMTTLIKKTIFRDTKSNIAVTLLKNTLADDLGLTAKDFGLLSRNSTMDFAAMLCRQFTTMRRPMETLTPPPHFL
jgi:hypothetical protein